jgi:large subunit ribosomal protein L33
MALKKGLILVKLVSSAKTGYFKIRIKNPKKLQKKLSFMMYDPVVRKHVLFEEKKA